MAERERTTMAEHCELGVREALHGNATAFGYSVTITASYGAVQNQQGSPGFLDLLLYGLGAVAAFSVLEGIASRGFREPVPSGSDVVRMLGTSLAFVSIVLAISAAYLVAGLTHGPGMWFAAAATSSTLFVFAEGLEFTAAAWMQRRRDTDN